MIVLCLGLVEDTRSQSNPLLPPAPLPSDSEQIASVIQSFTSALIRGDARSARALFSEPVDLTAAKKGKVAAPASASRDAVTLSSLSAGRIVLDGKTNASVHCTLSNCDGSNASECDLLLEKVGASWRIKNTPEAQEIVSPLSRRSASSGKHATPNSTGPGDGDPPPPPPTTPPAQTPVTIRMNSNMQFSIPLPLIDQDPANPVYLLTSNYTNDKIERRLFSCNSRVVVDGWYDPSDPDGGVMFNLDPLWQRIVFTKKNSWIRGYPSQSGQYKFSEPNGIAVDVNGAIYVSDRSNHCIVKLQYDNASGTINFTSTIRSIDVVSPADVAIDQQGSLSNPTLPYEDRIWVADDLLNQLVAFNRDGNITQKITHYEVGLATYPVSMPHKLQTQDNDRIGFIDGARNAFVIVTRPSDETSTTAVALNSTVFDPATSQLSAIGQDVNNEWWVSDTKANLVHHFTIDGSYIASATTPQPLVTISKSPYKRAGSLSRSVYLYNVEVWSPTTGTYCSLPGTDALDLTVTDNGSLCYKQVDFLLTNRSEVKAYLDWGSGSTEDSVLFFSGFLEAGTQVLQLNKYLMGGGTTYRVVLDLKPAHYGDYGDYWMRNWQRVVSTGFTFTPSNLGASISPVGNTGPCWNDPIIGGSWQANPACPGGLYSYRWAKKVCNGTFEDLSGQTGQSIQIVLLPGQELRCTVPHSVTSGTPASIDAVASYKNCDMGVSISGPTCLAQGQTGTWTATVSGSGSASVNYEWLLSTDNGVTWPISLGSNSTASRTMGSVSFLLRCTARINGTCASAHSDWRVNLNCPPTCPFVYAWDGQQFQEDNNILPQSEYPGNEGLDVTDYYRLIKPIVQTNDKKYVLQVREFEHERSQFDQFRLLAIDHPQTTKIDVSPETGEIYQYITPFTLGGATLHGTNVASQLLFFDSTRILVERGDTLRFSIRHQVPGKSFPNIIPLGTAPGGGEGGGDGYPKTQKIAYNAHADASTSVANGLSFRLRSTLAFAPMNWDTSSGSLELVFNSRARLDYFNFGLMLPSPNYQTRELPLASASHSSTGDVTDLLRNQDSSYAVLSPGESIELRFAAPKAPVRNGEKRTFVLITRGRYETLPDSLLLPHPDRQYTEVTSFALSPSYPNPFNPITSISYQLPVDAHVSLLIYDVTGREVARLVEDDRSKGMYTVQWDAANQSSGMYFCRLTVTSTSGTGKLLFSDTQKLMVVR